MSGEAEPFQNDQSLSYLHYGGPVSAHVGEPVSSAATDRYEPDWDDTILDFSPAGGETPQVSDRLVASGGVRERRKLTEEEKDALINDVKSRYTSLEQLRCKTDKTQAEKVAFRILSTRNASQTFRTKKQNVLKSQWSANKDLTSQLSESQRNVETLKKSVEQQSRQALSRDQYIGELQVKLSALEASFQLSGGDLDTVYSTIDLQQPSELPATEALLEQQGIDPSLLLRSDTQTDTSSDIHGQDQ
ncbi:hypothetical protein IAR50_006999 [Cryptococcus sp. DSM 104548]